MIKGKLLKEFGHNSIRHSCIYKANEEKIFRSFLRELKPINTVIEIGTYQGTSACILSEYTEKVYTFDVIDIGVKYNVWRYLDIKNIEFNLIENNYEERIKIDKILDTEKVDLCFIDGKHTEYALSRDFDMCKECKNILVHDYNPVYKGIFDFVNNLKGYKKDIRDHYVLLIKED